MPAGPSSGINGQKQAKKPCYFGNARADELRGSGWFAGRFIPPEFGLRRQTGVEPEWKPEWGYILTAKSGSALGKSKATTIAA